MTYHNIGLRIGAACNQAAEALSGSWRLLADGTLTHEQLSDIHAELATAFFENASALQAAQGVAEAFPGTTVASPADMYEQYGAQAAPQAPQAFTPAAQPGPFDSGQQNVVQAPFGQQAPQQQGQNFQPQQAPGSSNPDDAKWQALFSNPNGYYDNRQDKRNPNGPDFKPKNGTPGEALWLKGKYGNAPQWVFDRLQGGYGPVQ